MPDPASSLLAFDPAGVLRLGDQAELVEVGVTLSRDTGLVVCVEHDDGTTTTLSIPAERVAWQHVAETGRSAA